MFSTEQNSTPFYCCMWRVHRHLQISAFTQTRGIQDDSKQTMQKHIQVYFQYPICFFSFLLSTVLDDSASLYASHKCTNAFSLMQFSAPMALDISSHEISITHSPGQAEILSKQVSRHQRTAGIFPRGRNNEQNNLLDFCLVEERQRDTGNKCKCLLWFPK